MKMCVHASQTCVELVSCSYLNMLNIQKFRINIRGTYDKNTTFLRWIIIMKQWFTPNHA